MPRWKTPACRNHGFTLTELLVVIAVISLLAALLLPSLAKTKQKARLTQCESNLRQISLGLLQYADVNASYPYYLMVVGGTRQLHHLG